MRVFVREAFLVPMKYVSPEKLEEAYEKNTFQFFNESACEKCPYFEDRPCETCEECPNNLGKVRVAKIVSKGDSSYLSLPIGNKKGVRELFLGKELEFVDKNPKIPMKSKPKFLGKLFDYQRPAVVDLITKRYGVLKSKARSGKTVMAAAAICELRQKTLIIASQRDWLDNFMETFVGSKTQKALTDIPKNRIGFAKTLEDFKKFDIALTTSQAFISPKGQQLLKKIKGMFSVVFCDEVHRGNASHFAKVIASLAAYRKIGLSATPQRKDGRHLIVRSIVGPVIHQTETESLVPRVQFVYTNISPKKEYKTWTGMISFLELCPERIKLLAKYAIADAKKGHLVLIPLSRVTAIKVLAEAINRMVGKEIALPFYGNITKEERIKTIQRARDYKIRILVGNTKLISTGINIPRASCIYQCTPSNNKPNAEQRWSRILTPFENKPEPMIRVFGDDMKVVRSCFRGEYWGVLHPLFKPKMTDDTRSKLFDWMNGKKVDKFSSFHSGGAL